MHKTPELPVDLARVLYECKTCKARGGVKSEIKHGPACQGKTQTIGSLVDHICTKSGKYPHVSRSSSK